MNFDTLEKQIYGKAYHSLVTHKVWGDITNSICIPFQNTADESIRESFRLMLESLRLPHRFSVKIGQYNKVQSYDFSCNTKKIN